MAQLYAALKMKMGTWTYYSVTMKMSDVANEIKFAHEVSDNATIDQAIQRTINKSRAGKQIVDYLVQNPQRFFNSIVVAALDGNPTFRPVKISGEKQFEIIADMIPDTFGVLSFDDTLKTYALDGQHRLFAIKSLIDAKATEPPPPGFRDEQINVIFVVPSEDTTINEFFKSYRRLFSSLNRHAKPTDLNTNIIMDEDDRFAIVTRKLFSDCEFFKWDGNDESPRIDTDKTSENLNASSPSWSTLIGLYRMNITLLWDPAVQDQYGKYTTTNKLLQATPTDHEVETLYAYLDKIWDALLINLPDLQNPTANMRKAGADGSDAEFQDHLLFRPIGQTSVLAPISRLLLNDFDVSSDSDPEDFVKALKPLSSVNWNLQSSLWRDLLTIQDADGKWKMRNEERAKAVEIAVRAVQWLIGSVDLSEDQLEDLKHDWSYNLIMNEEDRDTREEETFSELLSLREEILNECYS